MGKYICLNCGYIYDPEQGDPAGGVEPGTSFADIPDSWLCPMCYQPKTQFDPLD